MNINLRTDIPDTVEPWLEWLLRRRHGGDSQHESVVRGAVHRIRDRVLDGAALSAGMVLVDVGTGDGLIAFGAFERVGLSLSAVLTDVSGLRLEHAEECALKRGVRDRCSFVQTSAEPLDGIQDESVDVLTTRAVGSGRSGAQAVDSAIQETLHPFVRVELAMNTKAGVIVQQSEQEGALRGLVSEFEGGAIHGVGHPQQIRQGKFEGLGRAGQQRGSGFNAAPIQARLDQATLQGAQAEAARLEDALAQQFLNQSGQGQFRMKSAQFEQRLSSGRIRARFWPLSERG